MGITPLTLSSAVILLLQDKGNEVSREVVDEKKVCLRDAADPLKQD